MRHRIGGSVRGSGSGRVAGILQGKKITGTEGRAGAGLSRVGSSGLSVAEFLIRLYYYLVFIIYYLLFNIIFLLLNFYVYI
jgi:hypothetical protein